jgi:uncharacterized 2Fe-2S/4Fe-4S cluster protein (DUF4445 family)
VEAGGWLVREIGLAANPAMTALALGKDSSGLRAAPYRLDYAGGCGERLPCLPPLWVPPQIGPFAGGDVSAGLALLLDAPRPFLLVDMGTNGEFLLVRRDAPLLAASVPLGPALEGIGMRCGGLAGPGAVTAFHPTPSGLGVTVHGGGPPRSISGTGYLSLLQCLLQLDMIDRNGHFRGADHARNHPLASLRGELILSLHEDPVDRELRLPLPNNLFLTSGDVENILKVKAAFSLALECLLSEAASFPQDMDHLYLAGALGQHAPLSALEALGFLPPPLTRKPTAMGNTSLQGIGLLLRPGHAASGGPSLRERLLRSLEPRRVLDLASDPRFQAGYIRHMRFGHDA